MGELGICPLKHPHRQPVHGCPYFSRCYFTLLYLTFKSGCQGISPVVQRLRLRAPSAGGTDSIPGQGTKIPQAARCSRKKKKKKKRVPEIHSTLFLWPCLFVTLGFSFLFLRCIDSPGKAAPKRTIPPQTWVSGLK